HSSKVGDGFVAVKGLWLPLNITCLIIIIYAPQCDFNEVRNGMERSGSIFHRRGALNFNDFINSSGLIELPIGGMRFTRMNNIGSKLSKLDRFLVSSQVLDHWPNAHVITLPREFSDHSPILLHSETQDYGPVPFRFFNSWLILNDFGLILQGC
nr:cytochrome P450 [Tanacetum cinerariifolium]